MFSPYVLLGVFLAVIGAYGGGRIQQYQKDTTKWAASEATYKANAQTCGEANTRLAKQFTDLKAEVDGLADAFNKRSAAIKAEAEKAIANAQMKARESQPKIDELRRLAQAPSTGTELAQCRAAQQLLTAYAVDVEKIRAMLGIVEVGPLRTVK